jgi:phosphoserine phosphatase
MNAASRALSPEDLEAILAVTIALAAPFDLRRMLAEVVSAAKQVLHADRGSVWLYDAPADELVLEVATGIQPIRVRADSGLAGACARTRRIINVRDCYADARFDPATDQRSGYRTQSMLTLPLVDHNDVLVGVMQVLNKAGGPFDANDEALATALAAQCAVALQRARMIEATIEAARLRQSLELARTVQLASLPREMPRLAGYDVRAAFKPAELTGGDTYDVSLHDERLVVVLADASGHGIAPALAVTQMQAMLRTAFRLGADLDRAFVEANDQLARTLPDDAFVTAFVGVLDTRSHALRFHSGGQGPILHYSAAARSVRAYKPTSFPLGAMAIATLRAPQAIELGRGDVLVLLSDGIYEHPNAAGDQYGEQRVHRLLQSHADLDAAQIVDRVLADVVEFAGGAPQQDDITAVVLKRAAANERQSFARSFESLPAIFAFSAAFFARERIDRSILPAVDLALEELFTNMVKYNQLTDKDVRIELTAIARGVEVALTDFDAEPFDVSRAPDADVDAPIERREPGGLGLHLVRRLADSIAYEYSREARTSRVVFRKTAAGGPDAR